jgi:pilus assembly protein Flp/PilA
MKRVMNVLHAFVRDEEGATMIEYALLVALIAVVVATALVTLGTTVKTKYSSVSDCVTTPTTANCT